MSRHRRPHQTLLGPVGLVSLLLALACGGLPVGGSGDVTAPDGEPADVEEGEGEGEGEGGEAAADTGGDEAAGGGGDLFPALDPEQEPPFSSSAISCPDGLMRIRHPRRVLSVYCATGSGVRSGPYTEWSGRWLVVAATNVDGNLEGQWTRWQREGDAPRKVEERTYAAGVEQGDHAEWDAQGRLLVRGRMADGKRDGPFIERKVEGDEVVPGGVCYQAGEALWRTDDEAELASKPCGGEEEPEEDEPQDEEAVAEG
jgi:hypothetical protein